MTDLQQNTVGAALLIAIQAQAADGTSGPFDLSGATNPIVRLEKPSGARVDFNGSIVDPGTSGVVSYVTQSGDLNEQGTYRAQAFVTINAVEVPSSIVSFEVRPNIKPPA